MILNATRGGVVTLPDLTSMVVWLVFDIRSWSMLLV